MVKRIGIAVLATILAVGCLETGEHIVVAGGFGFASKAEARVGRPLTPVSYAGVARRTARRCAAGVYYC